LLAFPVTAATCHRHHHNMISQVITVPSDIFHSCTVHSYVIQAFNSPTNAQPICFKIFKFTSKYTINAFIVYFDVNFNILKQIGCALVGLIKDWIPSDIFTYKQQYTLPSGQQPFSVFLKTSPAHTTYRDSFVLQ
jgi:hypothetical protein